MKNYKFITISFVLLVFIASSLLVVFFFIDVMKGPDYLSDDKLFFAEQKELEKFYNEYPEMISRGKILDVKYTFPNTINTDASVFVFVFKNDKPIKMDNLKIYFRTVDDGILEEHVLIKEYNRDYDFYYLGSHKKEKNKPRMVWVAFNVFIGLGNFEEFESEYGKIVDISEFTFEFNFSDGTSETHTVIADKEKSLSMETYKLKQSMEEIINEYDEPESFIHVYNDDEGDLNKLIVNLKTKYTIYPEKTLPEIYQFFTLIEKAKNRKKMIENEPIFTVLRSSTMEEFTADDLITIMGHIKAVYTKCNFDKDSDGYRFFYDITKKVNEAYEDRTGKILVPKDFRYYEVDEVFEDVDWD